MSGEAPELPECLACGACCFSNLETYARLTGADYARLGERAEVYTQFVGNRCYLRLVDGHCAALLIDRERGLFPCAIYADRPEICRSLQRGSPVCLGERATKAGRPQAALGRRA